MILGIDEVGRGAWAGPLVVGACVLNDARIEGLTDSKTLSKKQREKLAKEIADSSAIVGLGWVFNSELDEIGLSSSLKLATRRAVEKVQLECRERKVKFDEIIIDGTVNFLTDTPLEKYASTLKKADLLISSVSAAAICAKVARDNYMSELAIKPEFLEYNFDKNVGYGTAQHRAALEQFGISQIHRKSFKPIADLLRINKQIDKESLKEDNNEKITTKKLGDRAEGFVAEFLKREEHTILSRNWRTKFCEIDIVSRRGTVYYFTEVKYRKNDDFGGGAAALSKRKVEQMRFAAELFARQNSLLDVDMHLIAAVVKGEPDLAIESIFEV